MTLRELDDLHHYATDKFGRCPVNRHDYTAAFERHLGPLRDRPITLWDIGIDRGGSLDAWHDYLPRATVVGIDVKPPAREFGPRVRVVEGSATDPDVVVPLLRECPPDVVIDDGSHLSSDVWAAYALVFPSTRLWYCVEDVGTQFRDLHGGRFVDVPEPFTDLISHDVAVLLRNAGPAACERICVERGQVYFYKG